MIAARSQIAAITELLEDYAKRGVFRGFSSRPMRGSKAAYRILWHRNQTFDVTFDSTSGTLRFPQLLVGVPARSAMYRELRDFVRSRHDDDLPDHRRIDTHKAQAQVSNRKGVVSLALDAKDGDYQYGTRKLIHLVHEIFMTFLVEGNYFEYMVAAFDLDPDHM